MDFEVTVFEIMYTNLVVESGEFDANYFSTFLILIPLMQNREHTL